MNDSLQLYTLQQVADILGVTRQTVYNLVNNGSLKAKQLKGLKGRRISRVDLYVYIYTT